MHTFIIINSAVKIARQWPFPSSHLDLIAQNIWWSSHIVSALRVRVVKRLDSRLPSTLYVIRCIIAIWLLPSQERTLSTAVSNYAYQMKYCNINPPYYYIILKPLAEIKCNNICIYIYRYKYSIDNIHCILWGINNNAADKFLEIHTMGTYRCKSIVSGIAPL